MSLPRPSVTHGRGHFSFVQDLCKAFTSTGDLRAVAEEIAGWTRAALSDRTSSVALYMPDESELLAAVLVEGDSKGAAKRFGARRVAFDGGTTIRWRLASDPPQEGALLPVVADDETLGVLEIIAPTGCIEESLALLQCVADRSAVALRSLRTSERAQARARVHDEIPELSRHLMWARTAAEAVGAVVQFCHEREKLPVAAWESLEPGPAMHLTHSRGLSARKAESLRTSLPTMSRSAGTPDPWEGHVALFAEITGAQRVRAIDAGEAVILAAALDGALPAAADAIEMLLHERLRGIKKENMVGRDQDRLDFGIALTAHELRGPILGSLAVLQIIDVNDEQQHRLLEAAKTQLLHLSDLAESLLRWTVAGQAIEKDTTDLSETVKEAIILRVRDGGEPAVDLDAGDGILIEADRVHLRNAIAHILGHAIWHSTGSGKVAVTVKREANVAAVTIEDKGPPLPASEREMLFHPFTRSPDLARSRRSLGLFASRREIEAHGGGVSVSSDSSGVTFRIELPTGNARRPSSEL
jgi:signal transduction histidine kinase